MIRMPLVFRMLLIMPLLCCVTPPTPAHAALFFADGFKNVWLAGEAVMPGFWGPLATSPDPLNEPYKETIGGVICPPLSVCGAAGYGRERAVQYFDKGRMEENLRIGQTYGSQHMPEITKGKLAQELLTGRIQTGDNDFEQHPPAALPLVGDLSPTTLTYVQLATTANTLLAPTPQRDAGITQAVDATGAVQELAMAKPTPALGRYDAPTQHNVVGAFAALRDQAGADTIGDALSEPFAATITLNGAERPVIMQVFACRVLYIDADSDADTTGVAMSDVGRQYVGWRYPNGLPVASADYTPFVGVWSRTGLTFPFSMVGGGSARWCNGYPVSTCDIATAKRTDTGEATMFFNRTTADTAYGMVNVSPRTGPLEAGWMVTFQLLPNDMARLSSRIGPDILLCGQDFLTVAPPEVIASQPCGPLADAMQ